MQLFISYQLSLQFRTTLISITIQMMRIDYTEDDQFENEIKPSLLEKYVDKLEKSRSESRGAGTLYGDKTVDKIAKAFKAKKRKSTFELKEIVKHSKVQMLKENFIRKLKRNVISREVPHNISKTEDYMDEGRSLTRNILQYFQSISGISLSVEIQALISFCKLLHIICLVFFYSVTLAFPQVDKSTFFVNFRIFSLVMLAVFMVLAVTIIKYEQGKEIKNLKQIANHYVQENLFLIDLLAGVAMGFGLIFETNLAIIVVLLMLIFKLKGGLKQLGKFQYIYIGSSERERYFGLLKIFLLNFFIGHVLSICLNLMSNLDTTMNWCIRLGIQSQQWYTKYIWGYYWGTNIMLTVGFGDLSATNSKQALALIFIETFSCITLAYNINQVGSLIGQMKADSEERNKKLKYFHRMCKQNEISSELQNKVTNFIEQSYQIKEAFQFDQYEEVLQSLPKTMQSEYRIQSNKNLFDISFFNVLNSKTLLSLAENVVRRIAHPDQIINKRGELANFSILEKGCIGFLCKKGKSNLNGMIIQKFEIKDKAKPKIISLDFIRQKSLPYDIKSLYYSIIYYLSNEAFMDCLRKCDMDYQLLCVMRDRDQFYLDSNEIYPCQSCFNEYHNKFGCPKYHYIPLKQHVIATKLQMEKKIRQTRVKGQRYQKSKEFLRSLFHVGYFKQTHQKYIIDRYGEMQLSQMLKIKNYHIRMALPLSLLPSQMYKSQSVTWRQKENFHEKQMQMIEELLMKQKAEQPNFWQIETDEAANYKYYFRDKNPEKFHKFRLVMRGPTNMNCQVSCEQTLY